MDTIEMADEMSRNLAEIQFTFPLCVKCDSLFIANI